MSEEIKFLFDKLKLYLESVEVKEPKNGPISLSTIESKLDSFESIEDFLQEVELFSQNINLYLQEDLDLKEIVKQFRTEYKQEELDSATGQSLPGPALDNIEVEGVSYTTGDFAYFKAEPPFDTKLNYLIGQIKNLWKDGEGAGVRVNVFFRPWQVKYKSSQKFYKNEVVKSARNDDISSSAITGKCYVQTVKDWCREKINAAPEEDSYVLESRYHISAKLMTKIKNWGGIELSGDETTVLEQPRAATRQAVENPNPEVDFGMVSQQSNTSLRKRKKDSYVPDEAEPLRKRPVPQQQQQQEKPLVPELKGFNFNSMAKTTKDLIIRLHNQRPMFVVPAPSSQRTLPGAVIKALGGDVTWFKAPPLDIVEPVGLSKVYCKYLAEKYRKKKKVVHVENGGDVEMQVDEEEAAPVAPSTEALVNALKEFEKKTLNDALIVNKL